MTLAAFMLPVLPKKSQVAAETLWPAAASLQSCPTLCNPIDGSPPGSPVPGIKDRSGMDLTEAEDIKKRWQEYTEELYKKDLHDPDNHDGVIAHLEPDILECEVKWALESITMNKSNGGDGIPVELFQILKDDAVKVLHSIRKQIWKTQPWPRDWKRSVFIPIPRKAMSRMFKLPDNCSHLNTLAK